MIIIIIKNIIRKQQQFGFLLVNERMMIERFEIGHLLYENNLIFIITPR